MKISIFLLVIILAVLTGCNAPGEDNDKAQERTADRTSITDTTPGITGIGGIFFLAENPDSVKNWYAENLGLVTDDFGAVFEFRNANRPGEINYLRWSAFGDSSGYLDPSGKTYMISYRVRKLDKLVEQLKAKHVEVLDDIAVFDYGKFVHILGPEGEKIELWEPVDSVLTRMGGPTNK